MSEEVRVRCMVYSRVCGFLTPVGQWNTGKQQEWSERKVFALPETPDMDARKSALPAADAPLVVG